VNRRGDPYGVLRRVLIGGIAMNKNMDYIDNRNHKANLALIQQQPGEFCRYYRNYHGPRLNIGLRSGRNGSKDASLFNDGTLPANEGRRYGMIIAGLAGFLSVVYIVLSLIGG